MSDEIDKANELAEMQLGITLQNHFAGISKMVNTDPYCAECGEEIPAERRRLMPSAVCCVDCQADKEAKNKHFK